MHISVYTRSSPGLSNATGKRSTSAIRQRGDPTIKDDVTSEDPKRWERCEQWLKTMLPGHRWISCRITAVRPHALSV